MTPPNKRTTRNAVLHAVVLLVLAPLYVCAQPYLGSALPDAGTLEIAGGVVWSQGYDAGNSSALETRNTTGGAGPLTLFEELVARLSVQGSATIDELL